MIRVIIENILLFLLPTLLYVGYMYFRRRDASDKGAIIEDAPLLWLFAAGSLLVLVTLFAFGSFPEGKPGQSYRPPVLKDGGIEPGRFE